MLSISVLPRDMSVALVKCLWQLLKPRVMSLVVFTAIAAMVVAPGDMHPFLAGVTILAIALGSGAAGAINMWYDRDIDAIMSRTIKRPIPAGIINPDDALAFGIICAVLSLLLIFVASNALATLLLLSAILFYVCIYTIWLKRNTAQNIVIGGAAGAFPPLIGWAAVTGNIVIEPVLMFLVIFLWTPPHFWALALYRNDDYKRANIPMMPVVKGEVYTKKQIWYYTLALAVASMLLGLYTGGVYLLGAALLNLWYAKINWSLLRAECIKYIAPKSFGCSILYLFGLFGILILDNYWKINALY